jgi:hypothetical protein
MHPLVVTALGTVVAEAVRHHVRKGIAEAPAAENPRTRNVLVGVVVVGAAVALLYAVRAKS